MRLQRGDTLVVPGMSLQVYVLGAVRTGGPQNLRTGATLLDALGQAGGVTPTALLKDGYVLRRDATGGTTRLPLHLDLLLQKGMTSADMGLAGWRQDRGSRVRAALALGHREGAALPDAPDAAVRVVSPDARN